MKIFKCLELLAIPAELESATYCLEGPSGLFDDAGDDRLISHSSLEKREIAAEHRSTAATSKTRHFYKVIRTFLVPGGT